MDKNGKAVLALRIEKTIAALKLNNMDARYVENPQELCDIIAGMIPKGAEVATGGSMTLAETGVNDLLKNGDYRFYYRGYKNPDGSEMDVMRKAYSCDWYLMSSNAVTEKGELYNVDGNGNRVSALTFGPKNVIVVIGANKLVRDLEAADERVRSMAAPANCVRLDKDTPCRKTGRCMSCRSAGSICRHRVVTAFPAPGRITVLILPESFGY